MADQPKLRLERDGAKLLSIFAQIKFLADSEREGLGFIPENGLREAIERGRIMALVDDESADPVVAGYIFHSGVHPHAKVQQVCVSKGYRRSGIGSALVRSLVSELETAGFLTIRADIASDLDHALAFYSKNGFEPVKTRPGGKSKRRSIVQHVRELDVETLFSHATQQSVVTGASTLRARRTWETQSFALDLNVYFDFARDRAFSGAARRLFSSALAHEVRVVVADAFVKELTRTSKDRGNDPILQLAQRLPRLPEVPRQDLEAVRDHIHELVFVATGAPTAGTSQSLFDSEHLAHAAISQASAFVTRDGTILAARDSLQGKYHLDILSADEMMGLLPPKLHTEQTVSRHGGGFVCQDAGHSEISEHLETLKLPSEIASEFAIRTTADTHVVRKLVYQKSTIVACGVLLEPRTTQPVNRMFVHVRPEVLEAELFVDHLVDALIHEASANSIASLEVECVPGQSVLAKLLRSRLFNRTTGGTVFSKVVLGRPLTPKNWDTVVKQLQRRTGIRLPRAIPSSSEQFEVSSSNGASAITDLAGLEDIFGPTLVTWPGRDGVIVPISRVFSERLLGEGDQMALPLEDEKAASFLSQRAYINDPRTANRMRLQSPILFYESGSNGGRSSIVAAGRITEVAVLQKGDVQHEAERRIVVDDVEAFSSSNDVLVTTFDNLLSFPAPVPLSELREIGAATGANFVTATGVSGDLMTKIFEKGWAKSHV